MRKLTLLLAFAIGYVLGAQAGRRRYEQIMGALDKVRHDPRVQEKAQQAVDVARAQAPVVADKVASATTAAAGAAMSAKDRITGSDEEQTPTHPHLAGPQGDLP